MQTQKAIRKPFEIEHVQVTEDNMGEVAEWCGGEIQTEDGAEFIKVRVHHPLNDRQTKAFVGDHVLSGKGGFKVYTAKAFAKNFDELSEGPPQLQMGEDTGDDEPQELLTTTEPAEGYVISDEEVAPGVTATTVEPVQNQSADEPDVDYRDAKTGQYVSEETAEQNPDTTVSETERE